MPLSNEQSQVEWVSEDIIRQIFNDRQLYEKTLTGELVTYVKRNSVPATPPQGEPPNTKSQIIYYYDHENNPVAIVHQYLRPNGTIGASGLPDPKRLFIDGKIISVRKSK